MGLAPHPADRLLPARSHPIDRPPHRAPPPVSPKSVFRLAHLLDLPALQALALAAFRARLTVGNVAAQLFSSTADLHDDVRAAAAEFAAAHWSRVQGTDEMRRVMAKVAAREVDQSGVAMQALAKAALAQAARDRAALEAVGRVRARVRDFDSDAPGE